MKLIKIISICFSFLSISAQASTIDFPSGPLATEPAIFEYAVYLIEPLKAGSEVTIRVSDIFDYIHRLPDGTSEGNETGALIQKYSK
jgi:hypothetical protein